MKNRILRAVVVILAVAALAGAGYRVWFVEQIAIAERSTNDSFDRQAQQLVQSFGDLRAAYQAYVADGQMSESWQGTAASLHQTLADSVDTLRKSARSPEGQGALESVVEGVAALGRSDTKAREFLASAQRLSASDVLFSESGPQVTKVIDALVSARDHETTFVRLQLEKYRVQQATTAGGAVLLAVLALLVLWPLPHVGAEAQAPASEAQPGSSLGIGHLAGPSRVMPQVSASASPGGLVQARHAAEAEAVSLSATAEVCAALARVQEPRELPPLLEQAAAILNAAGIVIWMPETTKSRMLRPALAHGYAPLAITRMGTIPVDADNMTAEAFRSRVPQSVPSDDQGPAALAAPLVTADGCSGVMAAELKAGTNPETARSAAVIMASQLAMLISPSSTRTE